ncbi:MAG: hypothetical protein GXP49_06240, partial [Deltaproteobacteria bacterium]|nr:hypothetical protein [Deltaproteobacteria bacterium]
THPEENQEQDKTENDKKSNGEKNDKTGSTSGDDKKKGNDKNSEKIVGNQTPFVRNAVNTSSRVSDRGIG